MNMEKKIKLSFVNNGEEFVVPKITVRRQEKLMDDMINSKIPENSKEFNREFNKMMMLNILQIVDPKVTLDNINDLHPDDFVQLFNMIWESGRELKGKDASDKNFQ